MLKKRQREHTLHHPIPDKRPTLQNHHCVKINLLNELLLDTIQNINYKNRLGISKVRIFIDINYFNTSFFILTFALKGIMFNILI